MKIDRHLLKNDARTIIRTSTPKVLVASMIIVLISSLLSYLMSGVMLTGQGQSASSAFSPLSSLLLLALLLVQLLVNYGLTIFLFNTVRHTDPVYGNLLDGFSMPGRLIGLTLLTVLFVWLWMIPFVILFGVVFTVLTVMMAGGTDVPDPQALLTSPASLGADATIFLGVLLLAYFLLVCLPTLIITYRYRMAVYVLLEHREMRVIDCIRASKQIMKGRKWECFKLDFSFIGWFLLLILTSMIPSLGLAFSNSLSSVFSLVGVVLSGLVCVWFTPYYQTTLILYYLSVTGRTTAAIPAPGQTPSM